MASNRPQRAAVSPVHLMLAAIIAILVGIALPLRAAGQAVDLEAVSADGWGALTGRLVFAVLMLTAIIEGLRWVVPGWEREQGVKLQPSARKVIALIVVSAGQACAFYGWPDNAFVRTPWPGELMASFSAGLVVSIGSLVFNELLWKKVVNFVQDRFDFVPARVKAKRDSSTELTPAPKADGAE